jgi:hypothetical protein
MKILSASTGSINFTLAKIKRWRSHEAEHRCGS